jgi:hypothetical protein
LTLAIRCGFPGAGCRFSAFVGYRRCRGSSHFPTGCNIMLKCSRIGQSIQRGFRGRQRLGGSFNYWGQIIQSLVEATSLRLQPFLGRRGTVHCTNGFSTGALGAGGIGSRLFRAASGLFDGRDRLIACGLSLLHLRL